MACLLDRIGQARPPRSPANGNTKTRGNIAGQIKHFVNLCQGLRRRRCEPLGSDGTAGRLWRCRRSARYLLQPRHADVEGQQIFHDHVRLSAERRGRKTLLNFLGIAGWSSIARLLSLVLNKAIVFMIRRGCSQARDEIAPSYRNRAVICAPYCPDGQREHTPSPGDNVVIRREFTDRDRCNVCAGNRRATCKPGVGLAIRAVIAQLQREMVGWKARTCCRRQFGFE